MAYSRHQQIKILLIEENASDAARIEASLESNSQNTFSVNHQPSIQDAVKIIHRPADDGCTLIWCGDCYDIPYRSLVPQKVTNLLVAGRSISATHEAMGAIRVMATCMAMGEAAGRAAKITVRGNGMPADIDTTELRRQQLERGVYLRNPDGSRATVDDLVTAS